ncbi:hypothetical protein [Paraflavitalea pollutisoli]|uniref:hypothetical protein n=1 Tax=Paraflavitalea pollutisoli TaxID=3034143 RepID=UPI0023ECBD5D|nr:hypothetical protein [Paraflavitalea sp. H1-2-19X]
MSKEAIATVIYHEAIHGLLEAKGVPIDWPHETMAESYQTRIKIVLTELFPCMPIDDASALGWLGLTRTYQFHAIKIYDVQNATGITRNILQTAYDYQTNQRGTASGCP